MIVALLVILGVCVGVSVGAVLVRRAGSGRNEDARFAHARALTTSWSATAGAMADGRPRAEAATTTDTAG